MTFLEFDLLSPIVVNGAGFGSLIPSFSFLGALFVQFGLFLGSLVSLSGFAAAFDGDDGGGCSGGGGNGAGNGGDDLSVCIWHRDVSVSDGEKGKERNCRKEKSGYLLYELLRGREGTLE